MAGANAAVFTADKTHNLIVRLQYNVIRAGLRRINLAYSRISLADVATRLGAPPAPFYICIVSSGVHTPTCTSASSDTWWTVWSSHCSPQMLFSGHRG